MKRKILYFALVIMLITSFAVLTGCGDMSKLAGSVSSVMEEESSEDAEGMQQMRTLARNMVFLMKSIQLGREQFGLPEREPGIFTNFVR